MQVGGGEVEGLADDGWLVDTLQGKGISSGLEHGGLAVGLEVV
jgi:hypothetical protein